MFVLFVLFCFVLFCFVLFCFVLFCFVGCFVAYFLSFDLFVEHRADEDVVQLHEYAAAAGEATAQVRLGEYHLLGSHGLPVNLNKAFHCFEAAAQQG